MTRRDSTGENSRPECALLRARAIVWCNLIDIASTRHLARRCPPSRTLSVWGKRDLSYASRPCDATVLAMSHAPAHVLVKINIPTLVALPASTTLRALMSLSDR